MPEVTRRAPVCEENEAHNQYRHEEIILSDHDALLLQFPITEVSMAL